MSDLYFAMRDGECGGRHVAAECDGGQVIDWEPERPRGARVRVRDHTCDCQAVFYELCQAGGLRFVRRTSRKGGRMVVEESPWVIASEAETLWRRLLEGRAR